MGSRRGISCLRGSRRESVQWGQGGGPGGIRVVHLSV